VATQLRGADGAEYEVQIVEGVKGNPITAIRRTAPPGEVLAFTDD
jgi:hypothetical protein